MDDYINNKKDEGNTKSIKIASSIVFMCIVYRLYVYVSMCMFIYLYVYVFICLYVYVFICLYVYMFMCLYVCLYIYSSICLIRCIYLLYTYLGILCFPSLHIAFASNILYTLYINCIVSYTMSHILFKNPVSHSIIMYCPFSRRLTYAAIN